MTAASAKVFIQGDTTSLESSIADTLSITARNRLNENENFVRWEIVYGTGKIIDATRDSTGFIPTSDSAALKMITRKLTPYEITYEKRTLNFYRNSTHTSSFTKNSTNYGLKTYFDSGEGGDIAYVYEFAQTAGLYDFFTDSTYTKTIPTAPTDSFNVKKHCFQRKCFLHTPPNTRIHMYVYFSNYPNIYMNDSIRIRILKPHTINVTQTGNGTAYVDSASKPVTPTFTKALEIDSLRIYAVPDTDNVFSHWEKISGPCTIDDVKKDTTRIRSITDDCSFRAIFKPGTIYTVTSTPTEYDFTQHFYAKTFAKAYQGVRFKFTAPSAGTYNFVVSNSMAQDSLYFLRYSDTTFSTLGVAKKFLGTTTYSMEMTAGQTIGIIIYNFKKKDGQFFINVATKPYTITLSNDGNGKAIPDTGYVTAYASTMYSIGAKASSGYRFSNWETVSGTPVLDNPLSPYTYVTIDGNTELKANFRPGEVYTLTREWQQFNFLANYYSESSRSTVRFTWTPPDTATYVVRIKYIDDIVAYFYEYNNDSTFKTSSSKTRVRNSTSFTIKGTPGKPLYWTLQDSVNKIIPDKSFAMMISTPYVLTVDASKGGFVNPSGKAYTLPDYENILTAWPYGGYKYDSWVATKCNLDIGKPNEIRTTVVQKDSVCAIKANFVVDRNTEPLLEISKLEMNNYPEICAQVSVKDQQNGHAINDLLAEDFTLTQDGKAIQPQVTSISAVTGVSVVIVVDQSTSMTINKRMPKALEGIRDFIYKMSPFDRTAIVGFLGGVKIKDPNAAEDSQDSITVDSTVVHQAMTSDVNLLLSSLDSIKPVGKNTNIITGTFAGINQIINETNPTAVIVFSDGDNNYGHTSLVNAIDLAKAKNTSIYSIALESETKYPLENLAMSTGGTFSIASDASELAGLYAAIRNNILSQYLVCYQTPDTVLNGETHTLSISTTFNRVLTSDSIQWSENATPPTITLTDSTWKLIENTQKSGIPLTISVNVHTSIKLLSVNLFLRTSGTTYTMFKNHSMTNVRDSVWAFTVPDSLVNAPGLDFYVTAVDSLGQTGKTPRIQTPSMEPYTIFVDNDIPAIEIVSVACEDSTSDIKTFSFRISDSDGIETANLYYRDSKDVIYQATPLAYSIETDTWNAQFAASTYRFNGIDYYLRVSDTWGATVRSPSSGYSFTAACEVKFVETDSIPEDTTELISRDSIEYSLIADTAEIYDRDLDGAADFVRVHFKEERTDNITSIDSIFWNSNRGEWRYVPNGTIRMNRDDGKWVEGYINRPFKYGLTNADPTRKPFLGFTTVYSDKMEYVVLQDKVGAVPKKAIKHHGTVDLEEYMAPSSDAPPDTLIVIMSEPIENTGDESSWENLFRYSTSCEDTATYPLKIKEPPTVRENGVQWAIILDDFTVKTGFCLRTNPDAKYKDAEGNGLGQGGVAIEGNNGVFYLSEVKPVKTVSGIGKSAEWLAPGSNSWEDLPDTVSAISVKAMAPYTADVYIFDGIANYVTHFEQKFGYDGEMEDPERLVAEDQSRLGFLYWDQRSKKGRKVATGVYIWKILFTFDDGYKETVIVKTGIKR